MTGETEALIITLSSSSSSSSSSQASSSSSSNHSPPSLPSSHLQDPLNPCDSSPVKAFDTVIPIESFTFDAEKDREIILHQAWKRQFNLKDCYVLLERLDEETIRKATECSRRTRYPRRRRSSRVRKEDYLIEQLSRIPSHRDYEPSHDTNDYGARFKPSLEETDAAVENLLKVYPPDRI